MVTALLSFPAGLYHATPWGHHVNEGLVEWPPSPWRLMRALISVGYTTHGWTTMPPEGRSLFERLAATLPSYALPAASGAHSRHYMPIGGLRGDGIERTTLVIDAFARINGGTLAVRWDVELPPDEATLFSSLLSRLGYLGRSESWVDARLAEPNELSAMELEVVPCEGTERRGTNWEQVSLLAPTPPDDYRTWLAARGAVADRPTVAKRAGAKRAKKKASDELPFDVLACLEVTTAALEFQGWTQPPGSRRVLYWRRAGALAAAAPMRRTGRVRTQMVDAMLLALATPSGNQHALPQVIETLQRAELLHAALASRLARIGSEHTTLVGVDADGRPLVGHRHAHVLPLDLDQDGHLEHVLVWAPMGFDENEQQAVRDVRKTYGRQVGELRVAIAGAGELTSLCLAPDGAGRALQSVMARKGCSTWVSATPFVPPRHLKARGRNTLAGQIQAELATRGLPQAREIEVLEPHAPELLPFRHYKLSRQRGAPPPQRMGIALRLTFDEPTRGPLCLGYASHFGLGRFKPLEASGPTDPASHA